MDKQPESSFAMLIASPYAERWSGGYPDGLDWGDVGEPPLLSAWVSVRGQVSPAIVSREPQWQWKIRVEREEINAAVTAR